VGTLLYAFIPPATALSAYSFYKQGHVDIRKGNVDNGFGGHAVGCKNSNVFIGKDNPFDYGILNLKYLFL
jgi:hypothetical protein